MARFRFDYPREFKTLPDYTAHAGQMVEVLRPALPAHRAKDGQEAEYVFEGEAMFRVRADDGWEGLAWLSELKRAITKKETA